MNNTLSIIERANDFIFGARDITTSTERQDERAMKLLGSLACDFNLADSVKQLREHMELTLGGKKSLAYKRENSRVSMCVKAIEYFADEIIDSDMTLAQLWADEVYPFGSLRETYELVDKNGKPKPTTKERLAKLMQKLSVSDVTEVYQAYIDSIAGAEEAIAAKNAEAAKAVSAKQEKIAKFRKVAVNA